MAAPNPPYRAFSGARARLQLDGNEVGWATGIQGTETIEVVPIAVLGEVDIQEHEIVGRTCTFSASFVRIMEGPLTQWGKGFPTGDSAAEILQTLNMDAYVYDAVDDKPLYSFENVKITSRAFTVDRGGVMAVNATFVATRMRDEKQ